MNARARLEERYTLAQAQVAAADEAFAAASAAVLRRLLGGSAEQRFAALEAEAINLTLEDRRVLLRSLREGAPAPRTITAAPASTWAVWRSRLRYRVASLTLAAVSVTGLVGLASLANSRTPTRWVTTAVPYDVPVSWHGPSGGSTDGVLKAGQGYGLVRRIGGDAVIRSWVAREGYAHARVPAHWLQTP